MRVLYVALEALRAEQDAGLVGGQVVAQLVALSDHASQQVFIARHVGG
jgi:hypothetical protein